VTCAQRKGFRSSFRIPAAGKDILTVYLMELHITGFRHLSPKSEKANQETAKL
jgi:hypothetical protein